MARKLTSGNVTFIDLVDSKKIDVYLTSNLPTVQIYDTNGDTASHSPNWEQTALTITSKIYEDGKDITNDIGLDEISWFYQVDDDVKRYSIDVSTKELSISTNELTTKSKGVISYICSVTHNDITSDAQITYAQVFNGAKGESAKEVQARYSVDGETGEDGVWDSILDTTKHKYIRFSYDGGFEWTTPIKIVGENGADGTSVTILGTAYTKVTPTVGQNIDLYPNSSISIGTEIKGENNGDSYLVDGYLCVYNENSGKFICAGHIQGPKGDQGTSNYLFVRYANDANGSGMSTSSAGKSYIGFYHSTENVAPTVTNAATWKWVKFVGDNGKNITLTASAQAFKLNKEGIISPSTITVTAQTYNTTVSKWTYSTDGGKTFSDSATGVTQNGNIVTIYGSLMTTSSISIKASDDSTYNDIFTVYKVSDGVDGTSGEDGSPAYTAFLTNENISFVANPQGEIVDETTVYGNVVVYKGTEKILPTLDNIDNLPDGITITSSVWDEDDKELQLAITVAEGATLGSADSNYGSITIPIISPISVDLKLNWSKINTGAQGEAAPEVKARYSVNGTSGWTEAFNSTHKYVSFSYDGGTTWSTAIKIVGDNAKSVVLNADAQIFKVNKSNVISPTSIKVTAQTLNTTITSWTYSTDGGQTFSSTLPSGVARNETTITITGKDMVANSIVIKASDGTYSDTMTIYKVSDGVDGGDGASAPISFLTNENVTFAANASGQITSTSFTTKLVAYNGNTKTTPVLGTISGLPTGMTASVGTVSNNEIPITISVTNNATLGSTLSNNGVVTIPVTSPVKTDLQLTWSKINTGLTGAKGNDGVGINSTTVDYGVSDSASVKPTTWQQDIPTVAEGKYLWTRTVTDYTDTSKSDTVTYVYAKQGSKGDTGTAGTSVTVKSIKYQAGTSATTAPTGTWSDSVVVVTEGNYLWTQTTFSDNKVAYGVAKQGAKGDKGVAAVSFQVYAPNGYLLTKELESLTLQTFAYEGSTAITSGATYQWSQLIDEVWTAIEGATSTTYTVTQADVLKAKSYRCVMTYKSQTYTSTVTVQDKTDTYNSIMCISSNATNNDCYWVLYTLVYSDTEEVDPLLGPISINAPTSPVSGDYWYSVDSANATVTLKKYNGTNWEVSTDTQSLFYYWDMINDGSAQVPLGDSAKVKVISCHDFTSTATLVCEVSNLEDGLLTQSSLSLTDASDPIVSDTEPTATVNGQIWIKPNDNGTYLMLIWDESTSSWISSDMDTRSKVYTSRPSSYNAGDLWITASDTDHSSYLQGTLLQAQAYNTTYNANDWSPTLRYDKDIDNMKETLNNLSQYVTITSSGLRIAARDSSGNLSPFTSLFTSTALTFYQGSDKLLTLANNQLTAPKIVVENELEVQGEIRLCDLKLIIESNGSFSFAIEK